MPARIGTLHVAKHATGGSVHSLCLLVEHLDRNRYRPTVLFLEMPSEHIRRRLEAADVSVIVAAGAGPSGGSSGLTDGGFRAQEYLSRTMGGAFLAPYLAARGAAKYLLNDLPLVIRIQKQIRHREFGLVHVNSGLRTGKVGITLAAIRRVPCICHERMWHDYTGFDRFAGRFVDRLIFISAAVERYYQWQEFSGTKSMVIHNAVDLDKFAPAERPGRLRAELGWHSDHFVVGVLGRLDWWKGHDDFILALSQVAETHPQVRGLIIGGREDTPTNRSYADGLLAMRRELHLEDRLVFTGHRDDIPAILPDLDVVVLCSSEPEPFGRVVIEGMAAGCPVVATQLGGVPEIVDHRQTGLLVPPGDPPAMAAAIVELITDEVLRKRLAVSARQEAERRFGGDAHARRIQALYEEVLRERRGHRGRVTVWRAGSSG